jgi:hypothetical protein
VGPARVTARGRAARYGRAVRTVAGGSSIGGVSTWLWVVILLFGFIKLPLAGLMLWIPYRNDQALDAREAGESSAASSEDDEGGSKTLAQPPRDPHPRMPLHGPRAPRRGPHGAPAPASPARVRTGPKRGTRVGG